MKMIFVRPTLLLSVVLLPSFAFPYQAANPSPARSAALAELEKAKAKAEHASENDRCYDNVEVVRRLVEVAKEQFDAEEIGPAGETLKEIVAYADRAKEASLHSGHKLKQAEIVFRKAQRRLDDVRHYLPYEDQGPVETALKQMDADHLEILNQVLRH